MAFILANWPLGFVCLAMIVAAVIDGWKLKVPNWLTFPLILSGWALGLFHNLEPVLANWGLAVGSTGVGGFGAAFLGTLLGFALLLPVYAIGGMGAGDVKMQMGFGSWVAAFFGLPDALSIIFFAFCLAVVIGGVMALAMILIRGQYRTNISNTREILGDLFTSKGIGDVADKAAKRKPRLHLLPYGIPLCIGFVGYLMFLEQIAQGK
ncbi:MAG: prepilin peptidase [Gemmataceae bacterium]